MKETGLKHCEICGEYLGDYMTGDYYKLIRLKYCPECKVMIRRQQKSAWERQKRKQERLKRQAEKTQLELLKEENELLRQRVQQLREQTNSNTQTAEPKLSAACKIKRKVS